MSDESNTVRAWVYILALVLLVLGAIGIFNLYSLPQDRLGGATGANVLLAPAPGFIAGSVLTLWLARLWRKRVPAGDLRVFSKRFGWMSLLLIFVVPIIALVGASAMTKPEASWTFVFLPSYASFSTGIAVLLFSGVLSHLARHG